MEAIESGSFARKWVERYESGDRLQAERAHDLTLPIEAAGAELRSRLGSATK
jgi:ketol-acid reductoisomerase